MVGLLVVKLPYRGHYYTNCPSLKQRHYNSLCPYMAEFFFVCGWSMRYGAWAQSSNLVSKRPFSVLVFQKKNEIGKELDISSHLFNYLENSNNLKILSPILQSLKWVELRLCLTSQSDAARIVNLAGPLPRLQKCSVL